jgi:hypothetical protein
MDSGGLYGTLRASFGRIQTECPPVSLCRHLGFMDNRQKECYVGRIISMASTGQSSAQNPHAIQTLSSARTGYPFLSAVSFV